jgi:hypothetical protein
MKKADLVVLVTIALIVFAFINFSAILNSYLTINKNHGMITSFIKFGLLATFGEMLGLRIKTGYYVQKGFGIIPKIIVWGFIGLTIKMAFVIFATGTPQFLCYLGIKDAATTFNSDFTLAKLGVSFAISCAMNIIYAPVMMTFHKITDLHIASNNGKLRSIIKPIAFSEIFSKIDWNIQWHFVFKKTIPLFWIPAHTVTFLLPSEFQVLFAAILSIVLGLILALATL